MNKKEERKAKAVIKKNIPFLKLVILKLTAKYAKGHSETLPASKVKKIIHDYLKTGKITERDAVAIYTDVRGYVIGLGTAVPVVVAMIATFSHTPLLVTPITFAIMAYLTSRGDFLSVFYPKNLSDEDIVEYEKLTQKRYYVQDKKKLGFFKGLFKNRKL